MSTKEAEKRNISTIFLLRALGIIDKHERLENSRIINFGFKSAYIADANSEMTVEYPVYLLFKQKNFTSTFQEFVDEQYATGLLRYDYDYPNGYVVLLYSFPQAFREDYTKILEGKYSKTSKAFQELFANEVMVGSIMVKSLWYRIFNKDKGMQERVVELIGEDWDDSMEVYSSPYLTKETLDIEKYITK